MPKILVIDDEEDIRDVLKDLLELEGYEIELAADGNAGIKRFRESNPDLIIIDVVMPHKDGVAVIKEIRKEHPSVKIIAISGGGKLNPVNYLPEAISTTVYLAAADVAGANLTLTKPFNKEELLNAVRSLRSD